MDARPPQSAPPRRSPRTSPSSGGQPPAPDPSPSANQKPTLAQLKLSGKMKKRQPPQPQLIVGDHFQKARDSSTVTRLPTGITYSLRMTEHRNLWDEKHLERPERFTSILQRCTQLGLLDRCQLIQPRDATVHELQLQHTPEHVRKLEEICRQPSVLDLEESASQYDAIYFHPATAELSKLSCGSTLELVEAVARGRVQNGMGVVRPPGHHAGPEEFCGYCYYNNVAIAARKVLEEGLAKKILIVDWDVHHGQATQRMFYNDPRVLYFSTHRYELGNFWPNLPESDFNWVGAGQGLGFNCNVPLNRVGMGDREFAAVWWQVLMPMAYGFAPDLILISAGYDAGLGCPEGEMRLSPQFYPHLLHPLLALANGRVAVILEGGYCLKSLAEGAALTLRCLLGDPCPVVGPLRGEPMEELSTTLLSLSAMLREHLFLKVHSDQPGDRLHLPKVAYEWTTPLPSRFPTRDCHPVQTPEEAQALDEELDRLMMRTDLRVAAHKVGLVYGEGMLRHRNTEQGHPECPSRISNIYACHVQFDLLQRCLRVPTRPATEAELLLVHSAEHLAEMQATAGMSGRELSHLQERYNSVYLCRESNECALEAAGGLLELVDACLGGVCTSGLAIIRPPGHHAEADQPHGFCLYNNVAIAARHALEAHGLGRILIVDWDVHHGNGIQSTFYSDPRVLYVSLHRYDHGAFFPSTKEGGARMAGEGPGKGFNVNIPWNCAGLGDGEYLAAFLNIVLPIAYEFGPELVLVSAGFDAARGDPLGGCRLTPELYAHLTHLLMPLAGGRLLLALEGGYNLSSISYSMTMCTKALLGDPLPGLDLPGELKPSALESIREVLGVQAKYWSCLKPFAGVRLEPGLVPRGEYDGLAELVGRMDLNEKLEVAGVPEPPPACGEPSPAGLLAEVEPWQPAAVAAASGSGENVQLEEGAVGGAHSVAATVQEAYRLMFGRQEQEDFDGSETLYLVSPRAYCPHLDRCLAPLPGHGLDVGGACEECGTTVENWICLGCHSVHCSRYVLKHMEAHSLTCGHNLALSCSDLSVWCYGCDAYIDCEPLRPAKSAAHFSKFGTRLPE